MLCFIIKIEIFVQVPGL